MPYFFEQVFNAAGPNIEDYVEFELLDPQLCNFFPDDKVIDLYSRPGEMVQKNSPLNSQDAEEMNRFFAYTKKLYEQMGKAISRREKVIGARYREWKATRYRFLPFIY